VLDSHNRTYTHVEEAKNDPSAYAKAQKSKLIEIQRKQIAADKAARQGRSTRINEQTKESIENLFIRKEVESVKDFVRCEMCGEEIKIRLRGRGPQKKYCDRCSRIRKTQSVRNFRRRKAEEQNK
jgi:hypothetical protein